MKKHLFLAILTLKISFSVIAQNLIAVQNNATPTFFTNLDSAIVHAQNGDTIYIPGGSFPLSVTVSKRIHIVGVGHNPDSTTATARTVLNGQLILTSGADNGFITGVYFMPTYNAYSPSVRITGNITGYTISRCYVTNGIRFDSTANNFVIKENIIGNHDGVMSIYLPRTSQISNNIILASISSNGGNEYKNNIFTYCTPWGGVLLCSSEMVKNNIMTNCGCYYCPSNSVFQNNVNAGTNGVDGQGNQGNGNFLAGTPLDSIFVNYNTQIGWSYSSDMHLRSGSPYMNAGTDGTDIGIYGGTFPWKEGSIPFNPHIQSKQISATTDNNGNLPVNIKVKAQDN